MLGEHASDRTGDVFRLAVERSARRCRRSAHGGPLADMSAIVATASAEKYRNGLTVIPGGRCPLRGRRRGRRTRSAAEIVLDDRMHTVFVRMGSVPSAGFEDIRRRRQHPWRVLARRIVEAHSANIDRSKVRAVALDLLDWIDRLYDTRGETVTERVYFQSPRLCA